MVGIHISKRPTELDIALGNDTGRAISVHSADKLDRHPLVSLHAVCASKFFPFRSGPAHIRIFEEIEDALRPISLLINLRRIFRHFVIVKDIQYIRGGRITIHADIRPVCLILCSGRTFYRFFGLLEILQRLVQLVLGTETPPRLAPGRFIGFGRTDLLPFGPIVAKTCRRVVVSDRAVIILREIFVIVAPTILRAVPGQIPGFLIPSLHHGIGLVIQRAIVTAGDFCDSLRQRVAEAHHAIHIIGDKIPGTKIVGQIVGDVNIRNAIQADNLAAAGGGETAVDENISAIALDIRRQKGLRRGVVVYRHHVFVVPFLFVVRLTAGDDAIIRISKDAVIRHISAIIFELDGCQTVRHRLSTRCADVILIIQLGIRRDSHIEIIVTALHRTVQIHIGRTDEDVGAGDTSAGGRNHFRV